MHHVVISGSLCNRIEVLGIDGKDIVSVQKPGQAKRLLFCCICKVIAPDLVPQNISAGIGLEKLGVPCVHHVRAAGHHNIIIFDHNHLKRVLANIIVLRVFRIETPVVLTVRFQPQGCSVRQYFV